MAGDKAGGGLKVPRDLKIFMLTVTSCFLVELLTQPPKSMQSHFPTRNTTSSTMCDHAVWVWEAIKTTHIHHSTITSILHIDWKEESPGISFQLYAGRYCQQCSLSHQIHGGILYSLRSSRHQIHHWSLSGLMFWVLKRWYSVVHVDWAWRVGSTLQSVFILCTCVLCQLWWSGNVFHFVPWHARWQWTYPLAGEPEYQLVVKTSLECGVVLALSAFACQGFRAAIRKTQLPLRIAK